MWCPDCQCQVSVRLKPGDSAVRCATCGSKLAARRNADRNERMAAAVAQTVPATETQATLSLTAARGDAFRWESRCPISATENWAQDEDLQQIGRIAAGVIRSGYAPVSELDETLAGRGRWEEAIEEPSLSQTGYRFDRSHADTGFDPAATAEEAHSEFEPEFNLESEQASLAPEIQPASLADQVRAAARPSWLMWAASSTASILGGLALVNCAALSAWAHFGGRPDWLTVGVPGSIAGLGLLIVGHMLHGTAEKHHAASFGLPDFTPSQTDPDDTWQSSGESPTDAPRQSETRVPA